MSWEGWQYGMAAVSVIVVGGLVVMVSIWVREWRGRD